MSTSNYKVSKKSKGGEADESVQFVTKQAGSTPFIRGVPETPVSASSSFDLELKKKFWSSFTRKSNLIPLYQPQVNSYFFNFICMSCMIRSDTYSTNVGMLPYTVVKVFEDKVNGTMAKIPISVIVSISYLSTNPSGSTALCRALGKSASEEDKAAFSSMDAVFFVQACNTTVY